MENQLPDDIYEKIHELSEAGNNLCEVNEFSRAVDQWTKALTLLPEPKVEWEAYTWLSASVGDAQYQLGHIKIALESFFDALNGPAGTENPYILYRLGQCHTLLDMTDKGVEFLLKTYMLDGDSLFHDDPEGLSYLKLLQDRKLVI
ncbi:hypothetical protein PUN49_12165 [Pseudomonas extremaustralis]|uniref:Tetratricopeptide repeat protein n=1 Tax=Pseudomonas extremaustralis TaxID=359110 RepID=A0A5C5Q9W5_9PSED|nr:hypothetical protein [Pseudomonas extremaustralis]EZI26817.1 hypothetical protein PE143B_0119295 [Pseudomonas extremaustralis 14-3 substr. 14-3b]MDF3134389.1 hypothetical protein [Pseudomonas extremaustralis]MDG2967790.1 hypothetical protein [Pseudomonas extremaustralis]TWS02090.1 hypothetical protein FIV36_22185 [Pseudomonas extremaustralis]SDF24199.1 hypothetical protein SAMN05216591_2355 [Pseudomonas extremaustralis]